VFLRRSMQTVTRLCSMLTRSVPHLRERKSTYACARVHVQCCIGHARMTLRSLWAFPCSRVWRLQCRSCHRLDISDALCLARPTVTRFGYALSSSELSSTSATLVPPRADLREAAAEERRLLLLVAARSTWRAGAATRCDACLAPTVRQLRASLRAHLCLCRFCFVA
jgi:hypothetical protein